MTAAPSAQPKPSILSRSVVASVILRIIASMTMRVTMAKSQASPRVAIVKTVKKSQPSRKFSTPKMAAMIRVLGRLLTWTPGKIVAVSQTAKAITNQDKKKLITNSVALKVDETSALDAPALLLEAKLGTRPVRSRCEVPLSPAAAGARAISLVGSGPPCAVVERGWT